MTTAPATAPISARRVDQPRHKRAVPWAYIVLTAGLVLMIGPFLWMVLGSVKPAADFLQSTPTFLPSQATTDNYTRLFEQLDFPQRDRSRTVFTGHLRPGPRETQVFLGQRRVGVRSRQLRRRRVRPGRRVTVGNGDLLGRVRVILRGRTG
jgi:ABC-type maltose transport system permease subunit